MSTTSTEPSDHGAAELERVRALPEALAELVPGFEALACPDKEIAKLERAHERQLPPWYRLYLETLGRSLARIRYYGDVDLRAKPLIKALKAGAFKTPRYLPIGLADHDSDFDLFVDLGPDGRGSAVVSFESPWEEEELRLIRPLASRFSSFVLGVLATAAIRDMPATGTVGARDSSTGRLPSVGKWLRRSGAEEHPLSGSWDKLFVGPRVLAQVTEFGGEQSVAVHLGCMAHDEWWEIAGKLEHEVGLQIGRKPG